jgi:hypothetical protein
MEGQKRLWLGEYTAEGLERFAARRLFLEAITRHVPAFLSQLEALYPQYVAVVGGPRRDPCPDEAAEATDTIQFEDLSRLLDREQKDGFSLDWDPKWTFGTWSRSCDPADQFAALLRSWARCFHLEDNWVLEFGDQRTTTILHRWVGSGVRNLAVISS